MIRFSTSCPDFAGVIVHRWKFGFGGGGFRGSINLLQSESLNAWRIPMPKRRAERHRSAMHCFFSLSCSGTPSNLDPFLRPVHEDFTHLRISTGSLTPSLPANQLPHTTETSIYDRCSDPWFSLLPKLRRSCLPSWNWAPSCGFRQLRLLAMSLSHLPVLNSLLYQPLFQLPDHSSSGMEDVPFIWATPV